MDCAVDRADLISPLNTDGKSGIDDVADIRTILAGLPDVVDPEVANKDDDLGPKDITAQLDETFEVDTEEVRRVWKHHLHMRKYSVQGGATQHSRCGRNRRSSRSSWLWMGICCLSIRTRRGKVKGIASFA
ncbi:hypothetical protein K449DRAFT_439189 [Hypoxylon sp. EC38]|nr:hypothetical protein K449DRAFT_439189 [Hypoxylon sp. EC38]